ncbi:hypothetical protein DL96DRAFT_1705941 [Flagelloscypha sp. PMI_526]|nr:hypothetical protein DL96DRAFT_1705941 [Flagelloscypha sp. PMI_526]
MSDSPSPSSSRPRTSFVFTSSLYPPRTSGFSNSPHLTLDQLRTHGRGAQLVLSPDRNIALSTSASPSSTPPPPIRTPETDKPAECIPSNYLNKKIDNIPSTPPILATPTPSLSSKPSHVAASSSHVQQQLSLTEVLNTSEARVTNRSAKFDVVSSGRGRDIKRAGRGKRPSSIGSISRNRRLARYKDKSDPSESRGRSSSPKPLKRDSSFFSDTYDANMTLYWVSQKLEYDPPNSLTRKLRDLSFDSGPEKESLETSPSPPLTIKTRPSQPTTVAA